MSDWFYPCEDCKTPEECHRCDYHRVCKKIEGYSGVKIGGQMNASKAFDLFLDRQFLARK